VKSLRPEIVCLPNGAFAENCYLVADATTGEVAIVDPGEEWSQFLTHIAAEEWTLRAIWLTHAHLDHIAGVAPIVEATGVPVFLHPADRFLYDDLEGQGRWLGVRFPQPGPPDHEFGEGETIGVGRLHFEVRPVPGHSPGSVALVGHGAALVGDALFQGSVGRVDLPGGDGSTLLHSIRTQLLTLPDDTVVYPGHGPATTIGAERSGNPFLTGAVPLG